MSLSSYSDVFAINHDRDYDEEISPGDLVRTGPNLFPHFEVAGGARRQGLGAQHQPTAPTTWRCSRAAARSTASRWPQAAE